MGSRTSRYPDHSASHIVETLAPYVSAARQRRIEQVVAKRIQCLHIVLEEPYDLHNAAAVIRNCEAFGVLNVHIIHSEVTSRISRGITQGAHDWITLHRYGSRADFLRQQQSSLKLYGACMSGTNTLETLAFDAPTALVFGNEHRGLSAAMREACDSLFQIPMVGMSESLNLSVSVGISLYDVTTRKRRQGIGSDLSPQQAEALTAEYYLNSVKSRLAEQLLPPIVA